MESIEREPDHIVARISLEVNHDRRPLQVEFVGGQRVELIEGNSARVRQAVRADQVTQPQRSVLHREAIRHPQLVAPIIPRVSRQLLPGRYRHFYRLGAHRQLESRVEYPMGPYTWLRQLESQARWDGIWHGLEFLGGQCP